MHKRLKGIPILNGDVMDVVQNGVAGLDKWLSTDIAPLQDKPASVFHVNEDKRRKFCQSSFKSFEVDKTLLNLFILLLKSLYINTIKS